MLPGNYYWFNCFQFIKIIIDKLKKKCYNNYRNKREVNNMEELAREYERKHAGHVTKITSYSFEFETVPNKDGKIEKYVVMLSYFLKL